MTGSPTVGHLRTEGLPRPMGVGTSTPRLSWRVEAAGPGDTVVGFRVQVGTDEREPADSPPDPESFRASLWDSGDVTSRRTSVDYAGSPLASRDAFWWRVRAIGVDGPGAWSEPAHAELGLLEVSDWSADWITHPDWTSTEPPEACPVLTTAFVTAAGARRARLYVSGLGVYVVDIDGVAVDDAVLEPGTSDYAVRVAARALDVTEVMTAGTHRVTVRLGEGSAHVRETVGRYTKFVGRRRIPAALVQLEVEGQDGSVRRTVSNASWRATLGATRLAHWYGGEDHDARLEPDSADADTEWQRAVVVDTAHTGPRPWWRHAPPVTVHDVLTPVSLTIVAASAQGTSVVADFGVNIAGRPTIALDARVARGTTLTLRPAELVASDGRVDQSSTGTPVFDTYTTRGGGESWHPQFCYHGFRYLEIDGPAELVTIPDAFTFRAEVLRTDDDRVGSFSAGDVRLERLHTLVLRAIESNLFSMPTDCPHREKLGWLEQLHLVFGPLSHAFDVQEHFRDVVTHMVDAQAPDGLVPDIAPELVVFEGGFRSDVNWGAAILEIPWLLYVTYDDTRALVEAWEAGVRYLDHLAGQARGGLFGGGLLDHGLGDWKTLDDSTPRALVAGHGHVRLLETATRAARVLGHAAAADRYAAEATARRRALTQAFVDPDTAVCGSGSQTSYALALDLGLVEGPLRARSLQQLVTGIESTDHHLTVGEIGLPALLRVLGGAGRHDTIHAMVTQTSGPGYGRMTENGSTALAEAWDDTVRSDSANHFMLGAVGDWLVGDVAGLRQATGSVGWSRVRIAPPLLDDVRRAGASYRSRLGPTSVEWSRSRTRFDVGVELPPGCTATLELPRLPGHEVTKGQRFETADSSASAFCFLLPPGSGTIATTRAEPQPVNALRNRITAPPTPRSLFRQG